MGGHDDRESYFNQLALEYLDALYGFAIALTHDRTAAEDLVQETYLRAVRAFGRLMPDSNLKGWLFAIMRNVWLNELRHQRSGPAFVELDGQEPVSAGVDDVGTDPYVLYLTKLEREEIIAAIGRLPRVYREIVLLRHVEGFSYQQISGILGCPAGTVMSRLGRAREKLRSMLSNWEHAVAVKVHRAVR